MWTFEPRIPMSLWTATAILSLCAIVWYAARRDWSLSWGKRILITALLASGVVGPLLIALNPTWIETIPPIPGNPLLTVLIDGTSSMKTVDLEKNLSRWQKALELAKTVDGDGHQIKVRKMVFGEVVKPLVLNRSGEGDKEAETLAHRSDLATAVRQATRTGSPLGHAVLMISDGAHNVSSTESVLQAARESNALATPIYTVTLGTSIGMKNLSVAAKSQRMIAFPKNPITLRAQIGHNGLAGQSTRVHLMKDETILQTQKVRLTSDPNQEIRFTLPDGTEEPIERFRIVADDVLEEVTTADNQTTILVQRLNAPIGVLVLEGKPYWDSKFLTRNLVSDPVVNLTSITRLGPGRFLQKKVVKSDEASLDGKPTKLDEADSKQTDWIIDKQFASPLESMELLDSFRLVILGRDAGTFLTDKGVDNLRSWISKNGGCLLCSRGAPTDQIASKLAEFLPVRWTPRMESRVRAEVTQFGLDTSVFDALLNEGVDPIGSLPTLAVGAVPQSRPGLPQILMQSTKDDSDKVIPIVTYQSVGSGQTIVVEGAGMWRWAFLPSQQSSKDSIYPTLWQSMIQWIVSQQDMLPGQEVSIRSDRATFLTGDRASCSITLKDPAKWSAEGTANSLSVLMQSPGKDLPKRFSIAPSGVDSSLFKADLGPLEVGYYSLKVVHGDQEATLAATAFEVRDPWFESLEVDARPDVMRQVSRISGGEVLEWDQVPQLVSRFEEKMKSQQTREEIRTTIWDRPFVLLAILSGWIVTWILRRQNGMI